MKGLDNVTGFIAKTKDRNSEPRYAIHSFELVITFLILVFLGRFIDSYFSSAPFFLIIFFVFAFIATGITAYTRYKHACEQLDEGKVWSRSTKRVSLSIDNTEDSGLVVPKGYGKNDE